MNPSDILGIIQTRSFAVIQSDDHKKLSKLVDDVLAKARLSAIAVQSNFWRDDCVMLAIAKKG